MKKVVVTGIGAVSPLGNSFQSSWEAAKTGSSGIAPITRVNPSGMKWEVAGEIKGFNADLYLSRKEIGRLDTFVHYAVAASVMAAEDAGLVQKSVSKRLASFSSANPPECGGELPRRQNIKVSKSQGLKDSGHSSLEHAGVIIGSSRGGITTIEKSLNSFNSSSSLREARLSPYLMPSTSINMAASYVAQKLGIKGYCLGISNACASGANAIGEAYRLIKSDYGGPILAGGAEAPICRLCIEGYGASGALSKINDFSASRPFDITRDGFVLAEGACILVLENYETALKRGAKIYGEIIGYGNTADSFHQTRPNPEGEGRAISLALKESGLNLRDMDYISAHAASTPLGDKVETEAIKLVFGEQAYEIPITSVKSMTGHMLSVSGAFEAAVTLMSMVEGVITPTINLKDRDPGCDLNVITGTRHAEIKTAVSNSFGFGGVNAVLVFKSV